MGNFISLILKDEKSYVKEFFMYKIYYVIIIWEKLECLYIGFIDYF